MFKCALALLLALAACSYAKESRTKSVVISLNSKWPHTPLLFEAGEFIAKENIELFWKFVNAVAKNDAEKVKSSTHKQLYDWLIRISETLLPVARVDLLKFALAVRAHSPAVEMQRQMALTALNFAKLDPLSQECQAFVEMQSKTVCIADYSEEQFTSLLEEEDSESDASPVYVTDHKFPGSALASKIVIFYGDIKTTTFRKFHIILKRLAKSKKIQYVLRLFSQDSLNEEKRVRLSGYGVELAIKSTEYKAQDDSKIKDNAGSEGVVEEEEETDLNGFNFRMLKQLHPELKDSLNELKLSLLEADELTPLKVWQLQDLSFQAGQRIVSSPKNEALQVLQDLSQNFPVTARYLTRTSVKPEFRQEVEANQAKSFEELGLQPGDSALYINGLVVDLDSFDLFQLLELLKKEEQLASGFFRMGFRREYLTLLTNMHSSADSSSYAIDVRPASPEFINNLDSDTQYKEWGNSVKLLIQPYFPGMIRPIARNFFTLTFIVDPLAPESRSLLKIAYSFFVHQIPIRIGIVFIVNTDKEVSGLTDAGVAMLNLFQFVKTDKSAGKALFFITELFDEVAEGELKSSHVVKLFKKKYPGEDADLVFGAESDYDKGRQTGAQFLNSSGLGKAPKVLLNGIPLDDAGITADRFEESVVNEVMRITPKLQKDVMEGKLTDSVNVFDYIMNRADVMPRLNNRILHPKNPVFLDLTDVMEYKVTKLQEFVSLGQREANGVMLRKMRYLTRSDEVMTRPVTIWIVTDLDSSDGRALLLSAIKHLKHSHKMRIGIIHNPLDIQNNGMAKLIQGVFQLLPLHQAKIVLQKLLVSEVYPKKLEDIDVHGVNWEIFRKEFVAMKGDMHTLLSIHQHYATEKLNIQPGRRAVIANGQIIGPLNEYEEFSVEDFNLLEKYLCAKSADSIVRQIKEWEVPDEDGRASDLVMRSAALTSSEVGVKRQRHWVTLYGGDKHSCVTLPAADDTTSTFDIVAIVDPLSREAQKIAPLLSILLKVVNTDLKLVMNCRPKLSEMPLKSFYRLVLQPQLEFDNEGALRQSSGLARFSALPRKQLLTLNLIAPDAWLVEAKRALHDLDNIRMDQVESDISAEYELEHLLLEGHCYDEVTGNPPRGLQFTMGTPAQPIIVDTIVMANLGYFQLKGNPGAWQLRLREGRSADIYDITTHDNTNSEPHLPVVTTLIDNFSGKIIRMRVAKKPDKINEHLLVDSKDQEDGSIWESISSKFTGKSDESADKTINIFTLASGHLYERFVRIMMLSVVKRASMPVKFWLLKNYLSPYFKEFLPHMAQRYNFSYELVQYRWPRWLHQQTEKQRLMWGYKILFLDVLFPLDVKKIIFVDADQVVRTDMKELMELDLDGAPYAYTPFCDSRKEMEGFRFWKRGYWANHLAGRRYHISALYVVDLKKFRQIAAGDRLRGQYQGLSADPNSLSNLDQDLPNNMVHQVKIKSLPQEWLWCETWCDDKSKRYAKTIDLCNNPQTKEPKLESAMRIIEEWKDYDDELKSLQRQFDEGHAADAKVAKQKPKNNEKHDHAEDEL